MNIVSTAGHKGSRRSKLKLAVRKMQSGNLVSGLRVDQEGPLPHCLYQRNMGRLSAPPYTHLGPNDNQLSAQVP
jgi:hypothetical protein